MSSRDHHLYVATAKFLFLHPEYGIVSVRDPISTKAAEQYDLSPLIIYGVTVAGLPIKWLTFSELEHPIPLMNVLRQAWHSGKGLRGQPDILWVNRHIASACPELSSKLNEIGVEVKIAGSNNKAYPTSIRSAQDTSRWIGETNRPQTKLVAETVLDLCQAAQTDHDDRFKFLPGHLRDEEAEERYVKWMDLPIQHTELKESEESDWNKGAWMTAWEKSLPPTTPRYFQRGTFSRVWLLTETDAPSSNNDWKVIAELAKPLIANWPTTAADVAKSVGITLRQLQWFTSQKAELPPQTCLELETLLSIEYDLSTGAYESNGPYILIAKKPSALNVAIENLSYGGDAFSYEVIPAQGPADPSWRYVFVHPYGGQPSIIMVPRGDKIMIHREKALMNFEGTQHVDFYHEAVATCAKACRAPSANIQALQGFLDKHMKTP